LSQRFAIVAPNYHPRTCGVGDHSMRVAAELRRRGREAVVFTRAPAQPHPEAPDVPVTGVERTGPLNIANAIARRIEAERFTDVIIQYTARMWDASRFGSPALPLLAARLRRLPVRVSVVFHEAFTSWNLRPDLAVGSALLRTQFAAVIRASHRQFLTTETRCRDLAGFFNRVGSGPPGVLRVGPNAVPPSAAWTHGRQRIGLFSTLAFGKKFDVVIEAFDAIGRSFPDAELVLLGDFGPPTGAARKALEGLIAKSALAGRIQVPGKLPLAEIAKIIGTLNVYLFPMDTGANTRSGTLPLALGSGIPVVATRGAETDGVFVDGDNVLFADGLDGPSFARAAIKILSDRALAEKLSAGGQRLYAEHLSWARIVDGLLAALD
jgi:glycosyltransferase involved in cell wall biosynthesis